jgi:hypothetical protein
MPAPNASKYPRIATLFGECSLLQIGEYFQSNATEHIARRCAQSSRLAEFAGASVCPSIFAVARSVAWRCWQHFGASVDFHFPFKVSRNAMAFWRIGFCLIAMNARTRAAPSRVPRNETMSFSDSSPSCGAGVFFPTVGAPSKK